MAIVLLISFGYYILVIVMVTVTRKYQVTIPKEVREALNIKAGDEVVFVKTKEGYVIMKFEDLLEEMTGLSKDIDETIEEMREGLSKIFRRKADEGSS